MLVLTRRTGQKIVIGRDITVTVLHIRGNRVKLGITCDRTIPVLRKEIAIGHEKFPENAQGFPSDVRPAIGGSD
jgi:carbon storage regulator